MRLIHGSSALSGQVRPRQVKSSPVGDGLLGWIMTLRMEVALQNDAYQLCDELRCDTICDFRTARRKYEHFYRGLFAYSKRRVYSCESSVQSGIDKGKKQPGAISGYCNTLLQIYLTLQGKTATYTPQWHGSYRRVEIHTVLCCWYAPNEGKWAVMVSRCLIDVIASTAVC